MKETNINVKDCEVLTDTNQNNKIQIIAYSSATGLYSERECISSPLALVFVNEKDIEQWYGDNAWSLRSRFPTLSSFVEAKDVKSGTDLLYWLMNHGRSFTVEGREYHRYGMLRRPFSIGCQPMDGYVFRQDDKKGRYYDILNYNRSLTVNELQRFELEAVHEI